MKSPAVWLREMGPGLILAAAGIGAGDVVIASLTGIRFGYTLLWAVVATAALKFILTEALARWQLATGETVVRAWLTRLPVWVRVYFVGYLVLWTFLVGASLSSACGIAGTALYPDYSTRTWGVIHAVVAAGLVALNQFKVFQRVMKVLIALMALAVLTCAVLVTPPPLGVLKGLLVPLLPAEDGGPAVLALLGGIGGSLTVICYSYWLRTAGWTTADNLPRVRSDVRLAYVFTAAFGVALVIAAAGLPAASAQGPRIALDVAGRLATLVGPFGRWVFLLGFWCTVFTAMLGVWQGVPNVYVDAVRALRGQAASDPALATQDRIVYLSSLAFMALPPLYLLWHKEPVAMVQTFSIAGAFFMPFLAATLLYLNNRRDWTGALANGRRGNVSLVVSMVVFGAVCAREVYKALAG